jgi:hypothetical protein
MASESPTVTKRRYLPRFTLRVLIAAMAFFSVGLAIWTYHAREQRAVVELIRASDGGAVSHYHNPLIARRFAYYFGEDLFYTVFLVRGRDRSLLQELPRLPGLEIVDIDCESLTDANVAPLSKLRRLHQLDLNSDDGNHGPSEIGDATLEWLGSSPELLWVRLDAGRITSQGIRALAQSSTLQGIELNCREAAIDEEAIAALKQAKAMRSVHIRLDSPNGFQTIVEWDRK